MAIQQPPRAGPRAFGQVLLSILAAFTLIFTSNCEPLNNEEQKVLISPSSSDSNGQHPGELPHVFVSLWTFPSFQS
jgi:hypothetical protein